MTQKTALIVTAFPLRDGEDPNQLGTAVADALVEAIGKRDGEGFQVLAVVNSDHDAKTIAQRAARSAGPSVAA